jgi:hypothetical protein
VTFWVVFPLFVAGFIRFSLMSSCSMCGLSGERASAKANMHAVQLALEDFAVQTGGKYPASASDTTPSGDTVMDLLLEWGPLENPYTGNPVVIRWNEEPAEPGEISIDPAESTGYVVRGRDKSMVMPLALTTGM